MHKQATYEPMITHINGWQGMTNDIAKYATIREYLVSLLENIKSYSTSTAHGAIDRILTKIDAAAYDCTFEEFQNFLINVSLHLKDAMARLDNSYMQKCYTPHEVLRKLNWYVETVNKSRDFVEENVDDFLSDLSTKFSVVLHDLRSMDWHKDWDKRHDKPDPADSFM